MSASHLKVDSRLLIIDDREDDVFLLLRALKKMGVPHKIDCAPNGVEGINYLQTCLGKSNLNSSLPSLVILDLKMPLVDGHEVLAWIRTQPEFANLGVYILSTSHLETDITKAKESGAADYWFKPSSLQDYYDLAAKIKGLLLPGMSAP